MYRFIFFVLIHVEYPCFCLMVCLFYTQIASIHVKCLALEGVLQQENKEKQPYKANYSNNNYLTQHTVHLSSGVKRNSHVQVYQNIKTRCC